MRRDMEEQLIQAELRKRKHKFCRRICGIFLSIAGVIVGIGLLFWGLGTTADYFGIEPMGVDKVHPAEGHPTSLIMIAGFLIFVFLFIIVSVLLVIYLCIEEDYGMWKKHEIEIIKKTMV